MSLDFFNGNCQEMPQDKKKFGIRDDIQSTKAYLDENNPDLWGATVVNEKEYEIIFTAIDKCIIHDNEYKGRGRCEGMLTTDKHLFLVELKDRKHLNRDVMIKQLSDSIDFLNEFNKEQVENFTHKKIFGCNKQKGKFHVIDNELQKRFFKTYKFRIDIQSNILII